MRALAARVIAEINAWGSAAVRAGRLESRDRVKSSSNGVSAGKLGSEVACHIQPGASPLASSRSKRCAEEREELGRGRRRSVKEIPGMLRDVWTTVFK